MAQHLELNYCPHCGHALEDRKAFGRVRRFCPSCERAVFREHKVAAGVLVEQRGKVLLVRRRSSLRKGLWSFPAGFVDFGEHPAEAAVRECREETGLGVETTGLLDVISEGKHGDADIIIVYRAHVLDGKLSPGDDADQVDFFAPSELPPLAFRTTEIALDKWLNTQA